MEKDKWKWKIDQYFEDKVWSKFPKRYASPHMFFMIGMFTASALFLIVMKLIHI